MKLRRDSSEKGPTTRLARMPQAEKPRPDETIRKRTGADLQNGWLARHGNLSLTDERLVFVPSPLDTVLGARRREISLDTLAEVERWPKSPGELPRGAKRPRMRLHTPQGIYEFLVGDMDAWIDSLEKIYQLRAKRGLEYRPTFTREGVENFMLAEE